MHRDNSRLSAAAGATAGAAPIVDRTLSQLLHKHHQDMLSSDSVLQCAPMLQDILDAVASSANPNTTPVVVAPMVSSSGKGAATTSTQSSSLSSTAALVSSILNYVHATCSGSTPVAPTDLQALTAPINTSSLRPLALMMTPSLILSLLEAQHYEMLGTVLSNNNDKSSDATITSNNTALRNLLLVRIYSSMRNAMQRNQSILYPENLPGGARSPNTTTNPANTTSPATTSASPAGSASGRVGGNSSNQQQESDCGPAAAAAANIRAARNRHDATYLSRAALRGQVMSAAVYQVPNYSGAVTFENTSVIAYTALCGFVYVWHNISTTRDMSYLSSARVLAKSAMTLLNDTRYWNLARGDSALCCVNTAMLHLASMSLGPSSGQTGSANDPTNHPSNGGGGQRGQRNGSTGGDDDGANLYLDALRLWSTECFLHAEHTQAALALLPLMAASGSC